jgi:HSP90 family molecular chaperone
VRFASVVVSTRLVSSPTAIVAESHGLSANMMRLMAAQASAAGEDDPMLAFAKSQKKVLEVSTEPLALSVVCTC